MFKYNIDFESKEIQRLTKEIKEKDDKILELSNENDNLKNNILQLLKEKEISLPKIKDENYLVRIKIEELKIENIKLKDQINQTKQENDNIIKNLKEENDKLNQKIELLEKGIIKEDFEPPKDDNTKNNGFLNNNKGYEKVIAVVFKSIGNEDINNYILKSKNTIKFVRLEEKLYNDYPKYKDYEILFKVNTRPINRFKSLEENNIKNGDTISLFLVDE
jgi:DNA repair exonuclease SbcCD ATPase subunit